MSRDRAETVRRGTVPQTWPFQTERITFRTWPRTCPGSPRRHARARPGPQGSVWPSGLGMHDDVRDARALAEDLLLDLARPRVRVRERALRVETEREVRHQSALGLEEAQRAGR